jgi:hypothetical protein
MSSTHTFFCDETGNSGSRFYYPEQPLYLEGGWIISNGDIPKTTEEILRLEADAGYTSKTKGASLKKSRPGRAYMRKVCEFMAQRAVPFVSIVEKRYAVCAKAVDTYFDAAYNPAISNEELWDPDARQARAQLFYDLQEDAIVRFAEAFRSMDSSAIVEVGGRWEELLRANGNGGAADQLAAGLPLLREHIQGEFETLSSDKLPSGYDSLNLPIMAQVFQTIEQNSPELDIVHDECASFEELYRHVFRMMRDAKHGELVLKDGRKHVTGFRAIKTLAFADSEEQPLLRAADYLVACCSEFGGLAFQSKPIEEDLAKAAMPAIGAIIVWALSKAHNLGPMPKLGEMFASNTWVGKCTAKMLQFMPRA